MLKNLTKNMNEEKKKQLIGKINHNRIFVIFAVVMIFMSIVAPGFLRTGNITPMLKTSMLAAIVAIGFTFVMIGGNFDLSVAAVINVGAVVVMGEFNRFYALFGGEAAGGGAVFWAWVVAFIIALGAGALVGLANGLLVAKAKVHSFIVTIGMLTTMGGFVYTYSKGNTISANSYALVDIIEKSFVKIPYLDFFTMRSLITIGVIVFFEILLVKTRWGRSLYMVGSNKEAAWQAGIDMEGKIIWTFVISGFTAALGGILFATSMNAAVPNFGERGINPLMMILASTIIGGTVMTGGDGSVVKTAVAVVTIQAIFNGLISMGLGFDAQVLAAGILLGIAVLYEAYMLYKQALLKGERPALRAEADELKRVRQSLAKKA